jgi:predicted small lipoprotein YifL
MCSEVLRQVRKPIVCLLLLAAAAGCGKKGPPLPPLRFVPAPAKELVVSQQGNRLLLAFAYPKLTAAGQALGTVTEVDVYEVVRPVPSALPLPTTTSTTSATGTTAKAPATTPPTSPAGTTPPAATAPPAAAATPPPAAPATPPATTPTPTVPPKATPAAPGATTPATPAATPAAPAAPATPAAPAVPAGPQPLPGRELASVAKVRLKLKGAEVGAATQGDRIVIDLPLPEPFPDKAELHYFSIKTLGPHGDTSEFSKQVIIQPRPAPAPPAKTTITARGDGIELSWTEPSGTLGPGGIVGYNIYRRDSQAKGFGPALHAAAATERTFLDTSARFGQSYIYVVTAVARREPVIESSIKTESEIKYVDRFPPPVPREPVALVEAGRVRLVWRGSEAPDLSGYKVYRLDSRKGSQGKLEAELLTAKPIAEVQYTDSNVKAGVAYTYRITAVDQTGNESEPAEVRATAQ